MMREISADLGLRSFNAGSYSTLLTRVVSAILDHTLTSARIVFSACAGE